jgi:hypothetical protein
MLTEKTMRIENLFDSLLQMRTIFIKPISTNDNEKKRLIACIARTSSVAFGSMYELQRQILGTKKCQTPNPIVTMLAIVVRIRMSIAYLIERAACYAPMGDLFCLVFLAPKKPAVNLLLAVHFPLWLPMLIALENRERVADVALIKLLYDLVGLADVHDFIVLAMENPYGHSGQFAGIIRYELNVRCLAADRGNRCEY